MITSLMLLDGWEITKREDSPFKTIMIKAPNGFSTVVDATERNPSNILYMMADAILKERENG